MQRTTDSGKNMSIEAYRILFTLLICLHHGKSLTDNCAWIRHVNIGVEFFFLVSGFFLYLSFSRESRHSVWNYTLKRLRRLYPEYLFAAILAIAFFGVFSHNFNISTAANELLMVQDTGLFHLGGYNYPCWYLSVMMVAGTLLYGILSLWETAYLRVFGLLVVFGGYTFITGQETGFQTWHCIGPVSIPLLRGFTSMTSGILLAAFVQKRQRISRKFSLVTELISIVLVVLGLTTDKSSDMLTVAALILLLYSVTAGNNVLGEMASKSRLIPVASQYCYTFYLNHAIVIRGLRFLYRNYGLPVNSVWVLLTALTVYSIITKAVVTGITPLVMRKWTVFVSEG